MRRTIFAGYIVRHSPTVNIFLGMRLTDTDPDRAKEALSQLAHLSLRPARQPAEDGHPGRGHEGTWSGLPPRGMEYWQRLDEVIQTEPIEARDMFFHAMLRPLGLEKGQPFKPDARQTKILTDAALVGEAMAKANTADRRFEDDKYRPDAHWDFALLLDADDPSAFWDLLDERASWFYEAVGAGAAMAPKRPGPSSAYLGAYKDKAGQWLDGGTSYRLRVPPDPPIKLFWSVTLYDVDTRALILNDAEDRRSIVAHGPAQKQGRLSRHPLRTEGAGRLREELDSDRPRQELVCVFPLLRADRDVLRPVLAAAGL